MALRGEQIPDWLDVSRETSEQLVAFGALVSKWNPKINLVSPSTIDSLWTRHILDSAQLACFLTPDVRTWVDVGSGGGFPALVLAIIAKEKASDIEFSLVESDKRKSVFLTEAIRTFSLNAVVVPGRIETLAPKVASVFSARATAALDLLCVWAQRHLAPSGKAIFPKGARHQEEVAVARQNWLFDLQVLSSRTADDARILVLENIRHA